MATVSQRLRELDRKVLREHRWEDPAFCAKAAARWWKVYIVALLMFLVPAVLAVFGRYYYLGTAGCAVGLAFYAGMLRAEHERIKKPDTFLGRPRPPGL